MFLVVTDLRIQFKGRDEYACNFVCLLDVYILGIIQEMGIRIQGNVSKSF